MDNLPKRVAELDFTGLAAAEVNTTTDVLY